MADGSVTIGVALDTTLFNRSIEQVESRVTNLSHTMTGSLAASFSGEELARRLNDAFSRINSSATSNFSNVYNTITQTADKAISYFSNTRWNSSGTKAMEEIAKGMTTATPGITTAVNTVVGKINDLFTKGTRQIGRNLADGISRGMDDSTSDVTKAAEKLADKILGTFKKKFQIASPSALMRDEVGVMISRGIAEGITGGASFIGNALSSVYSAAEAAYGRDAADSDRQGSLTQNIYLRDSDFSPYRTAKRIRRESEAIFDL